MSSYPTREVVRRLADDVARGALDPLAAAEDALQRAGADQAATLLLAAAVAGQAPDARRVAAVLPDLSDRRLFPVLLGACGGDCVTMLLDVVEQERMTPDRDVLALFFAAELLDGAPPPPRLCGLLRTRARHSLGVEASILLDMVARKLGDKDTLAVAERWSGMADVVEAPLIRDGLLQALRAPTLELLPERPPERVIAGFTVRRPTQRVGRNDPCPCGSGKKYKKCCLEKDAERASNPSPLPGLTRSEYLRTAGPQLTTETIDGVRPEEIGDLDLPTLKTDPLITALRRAVSLHRWEVAERAMAALTERTDIPGGEGSAEDYRAELINDAVAADNLAVAERQLGLLRDPAALSTADRVALELRRPAAQQTLARLEEAALFGLRDERGDGLVDLSYALLQVSPALGILTARASLNAARALDSMMLLQTLEEARDRLNLPPGDPARESYEHMLDQATTRRLEELLQRGESVEQERLAAEAEALREKLQESKSRILELEQGMSAQETMLQHLARASPSPLPAVVPQAAPPPSSAEEEERRRLRGKLAKMKQLLKERTEERVALRQKLAQAHDAITKNAERAPGSAGVDLESRFSPAVVDRESRFGSTVVDRTAVVNSQADEPVEEGTPVETPRGILVPSFASSAQDALRGLPGATARKAIQVAAALASGEDAAWHQAKQMAVAHRLLSCRVGIHHRLLFTIKDSELAVLTVIHRKDLNTTVKRYM